MATIANPQGKLCLTSISYVILGFLSRFEEATPLRPEADGFAVGWSVLVFPHTSFYEEPQGLAGAGYMSVRQESGGRRRKFYKLGNRGREVLSDWLASPLKAGLEIRDPVALRLLLGGAPDVLARTGVESLMARIGVVDELKTTDAAAERGTPEVVLDYGIHMLRAALEFWSKVGQPR